MAARSSSWFAAAEHLQPAAPEQGNNIAFANMDWKEARHTGRHWRSHRAKWQRTTEAMLRHFQPAVICFCEVGEVSSPLSEQHFDELKYITSQAWTSFGAAAEHVEFL